MILKKWICITHVSFHVPNFSEVLLWPSEQMALLSIYYWVVRSQSLFLIQSFIVYIFCEYFLLLCALCLFL